jgi:hypothetical protein
MTDLRLPLEAVYFISLLVTQAVLKLAHCRLTADPGSGTRGADRRPYRRPLGNSSFRATVTRHDGEKAAHPITDRGQNPEKRAVRRRSFTTFVDKIRHGRVLAISDPRVGSGRTHQTSVRRRIGPSLTYAGGNGVELLFDGADVVAQVGHIARPRQPGLFRFQPLYGSIGDVLGTVPNANRPQQLTGHLFRMTSNFAACAPWQAIMQVPYDAAR